MPAIITHHQFGIKVLRNSRGGLFPTRAERDAFFLGCQGPDPFFFTLRTPALLRMSHFASQLHKEQIPAAFEVLLKRTAVTRAPTRQILDAYVSGYLCHYSLDSTAHPYVLALTQAYCSAGVPGLDERDAACVHTQIESDIDSFMLWTTLRKTVADIPTSRYTLQGDRKVLSAVDGLFYPVARELYGLMVPSNLYTRCLKDMRLVYDVIHSSTGKRRAAIGAVERALPIRRHSFLQALSQRADVFDDCQYIHADTEAWIHPFTKENRKESFLDHYETAAQEAQLRIEALLTRPTDLHALSLRCDFNGKAL